MAEPEARSRMGHRERLLLFTILCTVLFTNQALDIERKRALIRRLGMCKNVDTSLMPMQFYNVVVTHDNNKDTSFKMDVNVTETINTLKIKFNFWKCDFSGNPDSCEYVLKDYENTEICDYIGKENEAWSVFIDHFEKKPLCPIKPDIYVLRNVPITTDFMKYLPVSDAIWKLKLEGTDMGKTVSCVELEMQISTFLRMRRKHKRQ